MNLADLSAPKPDAPVVHYMIGTHGRGVLSMGCGIELMSGPERAHDVARPFVPSDITCPKCRQERGR